MVAKKKTYNLDLFPFLDQIEAKNIKHYDTLSEESLKAFSPFVIMRWLTGCYSRAKSPALQIYLLNEIVNPYAFDFAKNHKKLLYNLLSISCNAKEGNKGNWRFIKAKKKVSPMPKTAAMIMEVFDYSKKDANDVLALFSDTDIINMAEQLGKQKNEISELRKEIRTRRTK